MRILDRLYQAALEADDITTEVDDEVKNELGDNVPTEESEEPDTNEDTTEENTDPNTEESTEENQPEDGNEETPPPTDEEAPAEDTSNNTEFIDKIKIRDNLINLYCITNAEIDLIGDTLNNTNDMVTIKVLNKVIQQLTNIRKYSFEIVTKKMKSIPLEELMTKYVALNRLYEISTEIIKEFYTANKNDGKTIIQTT